MLTFSTEHLSQQAGMAHASKFKIGELSPAFDKMIQEAMGHLNPASPLRIGIDCRLVNATGIGMCIKGWLPHLMNHHPHWNYVLFGNRNQVMAFSWSHGENIVLRPFDAPIYSFREQWEWLKIEQDAFDLLWIPHINIPLFWSRKLLVTVHDVIFLALPDIFGPAKRSYARVLLNRIRRQADQVMFVSYFTQYEFLRIVGQPRGASSVVYNSIDESWFQTLSDFISARPYIVCVGNIKPHKNLRRLIQAFKLILNDIPHNLVIIGKKTGFLTGDNGIDQITASVRGRIMFTDYISDHELRRLVGNASLLVQPSLYEGFGLTPLEAMAAGCPLAVSRIPALEEICGPYAAYFNPVDIENIAITIRDCLSAKISGQ